MKLYHKTIFLPQIVRNLFGRKFKLNYSGHAKHACISDRYGIISNPPRELVLSNENVFEVELDDNKLITKIVVRQKYDSRFDIALAVIPDWDVATVKSVWLNESNDNHQTLDASRYNKN